MEKQTSTVKEKRDLQLLRTILTASPKAKDRRTVLIWKILSLKLSTWRRQKTEGQHETVVSSVSPSLDPYVTRADKRLMLEMSGNHFALVI